MYQRRTVIALLIIALVALAFWLGRVLFRQQEWFDLQHRQMAAILRLKDLPPRAENADAWSNEVVTLHNVWGNATFTPSHCGISNEEMGALLCALNQTVSGANTDNSLSKADEIYDILLPRAKNSRFVLGYRDEFRSVFRGIGQAPP